MSPAQARGGSEWCSPGWVTLEAVPGLRQGEGPVPSGPDAHFRGARAGPERPEWCAGLGGPGGLGVGAGTPEPWLCVEPRRDSRATALAAGKAVGAPTAVRTLLPGVRVCKEGVWGCARGAPCPALELS